MIKFPLLYDEHYLKKLYLEDMLGAPEISSIIGCKNTAVYVALKKLNIPIRDTRGKQICKGTSDNFVLNMPVIEGGLLGDAMLRCQGKQKNTNEKSMPYFRRKNKFKDHIDWVAEQLCGQNGLARVKDVSAPMFTGAWCQCYEFTTRSHEELMPIYDRWYPRENNFKKIIPKDFVLDKISLLHWFLDDGSSSYRFRDSKKTNQVRISFSSECFTFEDQTRLVNQLNEFWSLGASLRFYKKSTTSNVNNGLLYRIHIAQSKSILFFETLGPPPVDSLSYKWKV